MTAARPASLATVLVVLLLAGAPNTPSPAGEVLLTILHTNDEHSHLIPHSPAMGGRGVGGFARLAGAVGTIRRTKAAAGEPVLLVSTGDFLTGTPFAWLALRGKAPELSTMVGIGYDAITLGNHEFDYGARVLADYLKAAGYPTASGRTAILAANTRPQQGHPLGALGLRDTVVLERGGLRVGVFGVMGDAARREVVDSDGVTFLPYKEAAKDAVAGLRRQGAHLVVALSHSGVDDDRALAREVPGIHLIVGGHSHTVLHEPVLEGKTYIVQAGALLRYLGVLEIAFHPATGSLRFRNRETGQPFLVELNAAVPQDPEVAAGVARYATELDTLVSELTEGRFTRALQPAARLGFPITGRPFAETPSGNLVTDAMRQAAQAATGRRVDFAFQASGHIRGDIVPSDGVLSYYDLVWPLSMGSGPDGRPGNPLVSFCLSGNDVRRALEISVLLADLFGEDYFLQVSGVRFTYDPARAVLFTIPFLDMPLPSTRAVLRAEREEGGGAGGPGRYIPLPRGDQSLYHVATDYNVARAIPMVGRLVPQLKVTPRDAQGNPVEDLDRLIVRRGGREVKVWEALGDYVAAMPAGTGGLPEVPVFYSAPAGRIAQARSVPLLLYPAGALAALVWLVVAVRRRRRGRRCAH